MLHKTDILFLVYGAGDAAKAFPGLEAPIRQQIEDLKKVAPNKHIEVAFQLDGMHTTERGFLETSSLPQEVIHLPEINTGDPKELVRFISWAAHCVKAKYYVLVLSGHGLSIRDALVEDHLIGRGILMDGSTSHGEDFLSSSELTECLKESQSILGKPIDVVVFDACLMSSIEQLYELAQTKVCKSTVAALDEISGAGLDIANTVQLITRAIQAGYTMNHQLIAAAFPQAYQPKRKTDTCIAFDLESKYLQEGIESFLQFSRGLQNIIRNVPRLQSMVRKAFENNDLLAFGGQGLVDLNLMRESLEQIDALPEHLIYNLRQSIGNMHEAIIQKKLGNAYKDNILGVSLFAPSKKRQLLTEHEKYRELYFSKATEWIQTLEVIFDPLLLTPTLIGGNIGLF